MIGDFNFQQLAGPDQIAGDFGVLKYQDPEGIQRLQDLEYKIELMTRTMARQAKIKKA